MSFIQAILGALFDSLLTALRAYQADQNLKELGYSQAQRDAATDNLRASNAVIAAQQKMAAVPSLSRGDVADRLRSGNF